MAAQEMCGGRALVAALEAHGVDTIFGIPGTHNLAVYGALADSAISHVLTRHEQGAGYAADGYARVTGRPGVCLTTSGPAILNAATAAAQAASDSVPVLFITPGLPLRHPGAGNGILHEIKDQMGAFASIVDQAIRVTSVAEIPLAVSQCFAAMTAGRPGPAYLEIPLDVLDEVKEVEIVPPVVSGTPVPSDEEVQRARELLRSASSPVILAGGGAAGASAQVRELAELLGAPVLTTTNGKGVLDERHPLALGAGVHLPSVAELVDGADVVLAVGTELAPADFWYGPLAARGDLIRVDIDPTAVHTNAPATVALVGDATAVVPALRPGVASADDGHDRAQRWRGALTRDATREGERYLGIVRAIAQELDEDAIVAADSAMVCYYGALTSLPGYRPRSFLYPTGGGTLGYGLPAALGAKIAAGDRQVMALLGDGGVMFTVAELAAIAQLELPVPVVVVDNGGYGEIRDEMRDRDDPVHAVALGGVDFPALARALGCHGVSAESLADLGYELRKAFSADLPTLIHVREDL